MADLEKNVIQVRKPAISGLFDGICNWWTRSFICLCLDDKWKEKGACNCLLL